MTDADKLAEIVALLQTWMDTAGPGSKADTLFGRQSVSVAFVHQKIHAIIDPT